MSHNRTKWPVGGGAIAFQPAWFPGHDTALIYMNMGLGTIPPNISNPMIQTFQIEGPTSLPYPGTICLPQVPLPEGFTVKAGDHATIQIVLTAKHGAALYNVRSFALCFWYTGCVAKTNKRLVRRYRIRRAQGRRGGHARQLL